MLAAASASASLHADVVCAPHPPPPSARTPRRRSCCVSRAGGGAHDHCDIEGAVHRGTVAVNQTLHPHAPDMSAPAAYA
eukprot:3388288-Rhodomonas_salina.1